MARNLLLRGGAALAAVVALLLAAPLSASADVLRRPSPLSTTATITGTGDTGWFLTGLGFLVALIVLLIGAVLLLRSWMISRR